MAGDSNYSDFFGPIFDSLSLDDAQIVSAHRALVDVRISYGISVAEYVCRLGSGDQRFKATEKRVLGGGGINFAMVGASLGHQTTFLGLIGVEELALLRSELNNHTLPNLDPIFTDPAHNYVREFTDANFVDVVSSSLTSDQISKLNEKFSALKMGKNDFLAICSLYLDIVLPNLDLSPNLFIDSGYGVERAKDKVFQKIIDVLKSATKLDRLIVACNESELIFLASEFEIHTDDPIADASALSKKLSDLCGKRVEIFLHTSRYSTLAQPDTSSLWVAPAAIIDPKRRTNAGDTLAGSFICALSATKDPKSSALFGNLATAYRLSTDQLPNPENLRDFSVRLRQREELNVSSRVQIVSPSDFKAKIGRAA